MSEAIIFFKRDTEPSIKNSIKGRYGGSWAGWRGSMIDVDMVGMSSGFYCTNHLNRGWWEKLGVLDVEEALILCFVIKKLKWGVLKVDYSQGNELGKDGGMLSC